MLSGYRVLELGDNAIFGGKLLSDLGAEIIKVEMPGGDTARNLGPFYQDVPHPDRSLFWLSYNTSKKSITLSLKTATGQELFKKLVRKSDFVLESYRPGYMESLGLGYSTLCEINPRIVMTSITPFGQTGPYADWKGPDLIGMAMGGMMYLTGEADRPPHRIGFPQAYLMAGCMAAIGSLISHYHRELTGKGQFVDVSMQESVVWGTMNASAFFEMTGTILRRAGPYRSGLSAGVLQRIAWPCKDGAIVFFIAGGKPFARGNRALVELMDKHSMADDFLKQVDWESFDQGSMTQELHDAIETRYMKFFMEFTKAELHKIGSERGIRISPMFGPKDLVKYTQLQERGYWQEMEHSQLDASITAPGPVFRGSLFARQHLGHAPLVGEHNKDIYFGELKLTSQQLALLRQAGVI